MRHPPCRVAAVIHRRVVDVLLDLGGRNRPRVGGMAVVGSVRTGVNRRRRAVVFVVVHFRGPSSHRGRGSSPVGRYAVTPIDSTMPAS